MHIVYIGNALAIHRIAPTAADTVPGLLRDERITVTVASSRRFAPARLLDMLFTIIRHARKADHVLIDVYSTKNFWYAYLCAALCRLLGLKYIPILHGGDFPKRMDKSPPMVKALLTNAYRNVVPSGYLLEALVQRGYSAQIIPNAIPISDYVFKPRELLRCRLFYVRSFSEIYNPQMALHVLKLLKGEYPDARLCMVGPDKDGTLELCKSLAGELGIADFVEFPGKLDKGEWHSLSEKYDIFINTTNKDNTPVSVIEAMALGMPVVSTNPGGIPFLINDRHDGLLVDTGDALAMAQQISFLIENPDSAARLARNARRKAEGFDWEHVKLQWVEALDTKVEG